MKALLAQIIKEELTSSTPDGKVWSWPNDVSTNRLADKIIDLLAKEGYGKMIECSNFVPGCGENGDCDHPECCNSEEEPKVFELIK